MKCIIKMTKIIISILFSFSFPFILPIIAQVMIRIKIFNNFDELQNMLSEFYNFYTIIYILIGFSIILYLNKK